MIRRTKIIKWAFTVFAILQVGVLGYLMLWGMGEKTVKTAGTRSKNTELYSVKGTIYDFAMNPITNAQRCYYLLIDPRSFARENISYIASLCNETTEDFQEKLEHESTFVLCADKRPDQTAGVYVFEGVHRYSDVANHLVGYVNGDMEGVSGLEKSYNSVLSYFGGTKTLRFAVDGKSNPLVGLGLTVEGEDQGSKNGVITTLDLDIQKSLQQAMDEYVEKGAAVVLDIHSGEIRAMVSRPDFDTDHIAQYLTSGQGELVNRALRAQTVGSVFKIVVAAAALEQKLDGYECDCTGSITIGDRAFTCPVEGGHGKQNLESAFAESCNVYFIALGQMLGTDTIMEITKRMGFGESLEIASGLYVSGGTLPDVTGNSSKQLANLSIGQGDLSASPVQIARLAALCGNGGFLVSPECFQGFYVDDNVQSEQWVEYGQRVISQEVADRLQKLCVTTVETGTGRGALPENGTAGGKTSSAQTGIFDQEGKEVLNTYFAGFFPADSPKYSIAVFAEDGISGGKTCAPVFKKVCEDILALKKD